MQSKYKIRLMRLNFWAIALLLLILAYLAESLASGLLLVLASVWLTLTASQLERSHRRPPLVPWQLLPSLLLAGLLLADPERHAFWLWLWPALLTLPQPRWALSISVTLAALAGWHLTDLVGVETVLFAGLVALPLLLSGLAHNRHLLPRRSALLQRMRLVPGLRLWNRQQLIIDLRQEYSRCQREDVHGELMLLHTPPRRFWPLAQELCRLTHEFENCYRLDQCTLATLLLSRNSTQARERRQALLAALPPMPKTRFAALDRVDTLEALTARFEHQHTTIQVETEPAHGS